MESPLLEPDAKRVRKTVLRVSNLRGNSEMGSNGSIISENRTKEKSHARNGWKALGLSLKKRLE